MRKIDEMQTRCDAATEGPWNIVASGQFGDEKDVIRQGTENDGVKVIFEQDEQGGPSWSRDEDAEFIASARTDMPHLIAALKAVLKEHYPVGEECDCGYCPSACACGHWEYPCPTVKAFEEALGVES